MRHHLRTVMVVAVVAVGLLATPVAAKEPPHVRPVVTRAHTKWVVDEGPHYAVSIRWDDLNAKVVFDKQSSRALLWLLAAGGTSRVRQYLMSIAWRLPLYSTYCVDLWFFTACHTFTHIRDHWRWDVVTRNDLYRAVVRASYIYGTCFDWQFTGHRNFNHTGTDCKELRR